MRSFATVGLAALVACAHLPPIKTEATETYFITESFCQGEWVVDYIRAERLREKYPHSTLIILTPSGMAAEVEKHYHGDYRTLSGFYDGKSIGRTKLTEKVEKTIPKGSLVFLMSHGDPKLNTPNMEVCPWNGWEEIRHAAASEVDQKIQQQGMRLTTKQLPEREVYPLNCSANKQYLMESELDAVVSDLLQGGIAKVYEGRKIRDSYIVEQRDFLKPTP